MRTRERESEKCERSKGVRTTTVFSPMRVNNFGVCVKVFSIFFFTRCLLLPVRTLRTHEILSPLTPPPSSAAFFFSPFAWKIR